MRSQGRCHSHQRLRMLLRHWKGLYRSKLFLQFHLLLYFTVAFLTQLKSHFYLPFHPRQLYLLFIVRMRSSHIPSAATLRRDIWEGICRPLSYFSLRRAGTSAPFFPSSSLVHLSDRKTTLATFSCIFNGLIRVQFQHCIRKIILFFFVQVIFKDLLNFKISFCHISRLLFFREKKCPSNLIIEVAEGFVFRCALQQVIYLIVIIANTHNICYVRLSTKHFTYAHSFIPHNNQLVGTIISPILEAKKQKHRKSHQEQMMELTFEPRTSGHRTYDFLLLPYILTESKNHDL